MKFAGLSGGIGAGKSTVAARLAGRGAVVIDVDLLSRELQQPGQPVFQAMVDEWGTAILSGDGTLDRQSMAGIVFTHPAEMAKLMAMTTPAIENAIYERAEPFHDTDTVVILESALLAGGRLMYGLTGLVMVDVPVDVAIERLVNGRGMSEADARARLANQPDRETRLERADFIVDNSGSPADLDDQIEMAWTWLWTLPDSHVERVAR
ncbi:MAG: dephospho-CoA kinase [Acidimicrobiia bacterium]